MYSPSASVCPNSPNLSSRQRLEGIRNATFILPATGERVHRQITLNEPSSPTDTSSDYSFVTGAPFQRNFSLQPGIFQSIRYSLQHQLFALYRWIRSPSGKGVLKCSLAYLIGSLATFLPPLAKFLGHSDGKHVVATVTVYFHPARSAGSMAEAAALSLVAFLYASFVGFSSMATSVFFEEQLDLIEVAYALILIVFCGGGLGFVGWFKQAYNSPLVSVACSLTSLAIVSILTKESAVQLGVFSYDKIIQVLKMIAMGITTTAAVNLLLWPVSARYQVRKVMIKTTQSVGEMLSFITKGFLNGSEIEMQSMPYTLAQKKYRTLFVELTKCLREAKFEYYILGQEAQFKHEAKLVNCLERLAQSIGGLRSAATTQLTLLKESSGIGNSTPISSFRYMPVIISDSLFSNMDNRSDRFAVLTAIEENPEGGVENYPKNNHIIGKMRERSISGFSAESSLILPTVKTPSEIFTRFIVLLGPSIKSLAYTLSQILRELPFTKEPEHAITTIEQFKKSLEVASKLYSSARSEALKELYKSKELNCARPQSIEADFEEVAASCGHFSFSLQTFAKEMQNFMDILEELKEQSENSRHSWQWLRFWKRLRKSQKPVIEEEQPLVEQMSDTEIPARNPDLVLRNPISRQRSMTQRVPNLKKVLIFRLLSFVKFLNRDDIRFAIKVGIGASVFALFAFIPETRPFYQHWRGEWGLVSYMLVCSMTIGASNTTGFSRFIGTFIGAVTAIIFWIICQENPYALAFCGWLVSLPCFYLIVAKNRAPFGRFIMLTYNLSCLYAYTLSIKEGDDDDDEGGIAPVISEIALHRLVAVAVGIVWGLIVTRIIWPVSARQKFQDGLSLLWLRMGLVWKRDPLATLLEGESLVPYMDLREEFALHRYLLRLENLRLSSLSEFELRGPFPAKEFEQIMTSTTKILDSFHAMNDIIQSDLVVSEGETQLLKYTADERAYLCSTISHLFQVFASSFKLEYPINDALPSISKARDKLLARIFKYRKDSLSAEGTESHVITKDEDYELLYAYILITGQLAQEIGLVETGIIKLYGVLNEDLLRLR
ncbi:hypothetical protein K3495_g4570 [Podosphaera aphanis]|nr:hypothetical protein K3495_g4570 [Podosphaera aphanis]